MITLRAASTADLDAVNALIERAVMTWDLPERVKRLSLPSYRYHAHDLDHLALMVAESQELGIVGVAAWEQADAADVGEGCTALLLHGIYVAPEQHRKGVGTKLLKAAEKAALSQRFDGLLVKAQPAAEAFFLAMGLQRLEVKNPERDYPHRFWKKVTS